jgi:hypothetical protein
MTPLCDLAFKYGSDKCPQIKAHHTEWYFREFKGGRDSVRKVFEMGVGGSPANLKANPNYKRGASLYMWWEFFPKAQIYGIDILPQLVFKDDRIETFLCDQVDRKGLLELFGRIGTDFDLVVDDASHRVLSQITSCLIIMPLLKEGAVYVIEDVKGGKKFFILDHLKEYNCEIVEPPEMTTYDDRLIVVRK